MKNEKRNTEFSNEDPDGLQRVDSTNQYTNILSTMVKEFSETVQRRTWRSALGASLTTAGTALASAGFGWNTALAIICAGAGGYLLFLDGQTKKDEDRRNVGKKEGEKRKKEILDRERMILKQMEEGEV